MSPSSFKILQVPNVIRWEIKVPNVIGCARTEMMRLRERNDIFGNFFFFFARAIDTKRKHIKSKGLSFSTQVVDLVWPYNITTIRQFLISIIRIGIKEVTNFYVYNF